MDRAETCSAGPGRARSSTRRRQPRDGVRRHVHDFAPRHRHEPRGRVRHRAPRRTTLGLPKSRLGLPLRKRFLTPLGLVAGFVDSTGGGGWGPVGTPAILASGRLEPRKTIGSIDTSEFLVAVAASLGFIIGIGGENINYAWVLALLAGGVVAAPIAAWLVRLIPPRVLGSAVGGIIILTNVRTLLRSDWIDAPDATRYAVYTVIYLVWAGAVAYSIREHRRDEQHARARTPEPV
jgi:hypothetical protein